MIGFILFSCVLKHSALFIWMILIHLPTSIKVYLNIFYQHMTLKMTWENEKWESCLPDLNLESFVLSQRRCRYHKAYRQGCLNLYTYLTSAQAVTQITAETLITLFQHVLIFTDAQVHNILDADNWKNMGCNYVFVLNFWLYLYCCLMDNWTKGASE